MTIWHYLDRLPGGPHVLGGIILGVAGVVIVAILTIVIAWFTL